MKRTNFLLLIPLCLFFGLYSCVDEEVFPPEPEIYWAGDSVNLIIEEQQADTMRIRLHFQDGDGDIGNTFGRPSTDTCSICTDGLPNSCNTSLALNIQLKDSRDGCFDFYTLPVVDPQTKNGAVSGFININHVACCKDNVTFPCVVPQTETFDTVTYEISIKDNAGNFSNVIVSPPIVVRCKPL